MVGSSHGCLRFHPLTGSIEHAHAGGTRRSGGSAPAAEIAASGGSGHAAGTGSGGAAAAGTAGTAAEARRRCESSRLREPAAASFLLCNCA